MAKSDSFDEQCHSFQFNGDLYHVYHINGVVTSILVRWDNASTRAESIEWDDLPAEVKQKIDDEINFGN